MSTRKACYVTLDVFTSERFKGNPLAIVKVDDGALSYDQMLKVTREFNYSETVFLRQDIHGRFVIDIFTPAGDLDFAGHPIIGTGYTLFHKLLPGVTIPQPVPETLPVLAKAGPVLLRYDASNETVLAEVPHNVHLHSRGTPIKNIIDTQPGLANEVARFKQDYPAISIVKGVTYTLVDLSDQEDIFARVTAGPSQVTKLDNGWAPSHTGTMYFGRQEKSFVGGQKILKLRVRVITIDLEDPATGSACCALAAYLALQDRDANGNYRFYMNQGSEIGRDSNIIVDVLLNNSGDAVSAMFLSGPATLIAEGTICLPEI